MMKADFLQTRPTLQLLDYDTVFAAGDVAQIANNERPKAGVFAVRAGPVLARNIRALLAGIAALSLSPATTLSCTCRAWKQTGNCIRGKFSAKAGWLWTLKCWIDKRFIDKFNVLQQMSVNAVNYPKYISDLQPESTASILYCAGTVARQAQRY